MLKIRYLKDADRTPKFESVLMEQGGSPPWRADFDDETELLSLMNGVLARQKSYSNVRLLSGYFRTVDRYFFDLDLTQEQAESLGWFSRNEVPELSDAVS